MARQRQMTGEKPSGSGTFLPHTRRPPFWNTRYAELTKMPASVCARPFVRLAPGEQDQGFG